MQHTAAQDAFSQHAAAEHSAPPSHSQHQLQQPLVRADDHPLRDHDRVITTPHVAYYSEESDAQRRRQAVENVRAVLRGDPPASPVDGG